MRSKEMSAQLFQSALATYRHPVTQRFLRTRLGSATFVRAYDMYKEFIETPGSQALARRIPPQAWIIDIGANIGFFTERFAKWATQGGRVIAVEPDAHNVNLLKERLARRAITNVEVHQAAAAEFNGTIYLQRNPDHPGDHRISDSGEAVPCTMIDDLVEGAGNPNVALIKIDVQGGERRVLQGASKTLQRCKPALFIEVDDRALRQFGTNAAELLGELAGLGYQFFHISRTGTETAISLEQVMSALTAAKRGYLDLLCVRPAP
jgi:FkbM family methyltransferase